MKLVRTFGRTKKSAAALIGTIERRGSLNTSKVGPIVRRILADVRRRGDAALRSYAAKFDALPPGAPLRVSREEMKAAWNVHNSHATGRNARRAEKHSRLRRSAESEKNGPSLPPPASPPANLCARWSRSAATFPAAVTPSPPRSS